MHTADNTGCTHNNEAHAMNQPESSSRVPSTNILLWASAFVIAALILIQAGRSGEARADLVASVSGVTALTVAGAASEDYLMVIDGRSEDLFVYRVENQNNLELYRRYSLPRMFTDARGRGAGGGRR